MKNLIVLAAIASFNPFLIAQTNTFPTSGNVGIGTTSPDANLHIFGSNVGEGNILSSIMLGKNNGPEIQAIQLSADDDVQGLLFRVKSSNQNADYSFEAMRINSNGNVGIGTDDPRTELDINGSVNLNNQYQTSAGHLNPGYFVYKNNTTAYGMKLQYTGNEFGTMIFGPNQDNRFIGFGKVGAELDDDSMIEHMRIDLDNGNVGIGTNSPDYFLHVVGDGSARAIVSKSGGIAIKGGNTTNNALRFDDTGGTDRHLIYIDENNDVRIGNSNFNNLFFYEQNIGIGTTSTGSHKLAVEGSIGAREIKVEPSGWSDFVFDPGYNLPTLEELEHFISENNHLPEIPTEIEVLENGIYLGEMDAKLLQKIEELTLYLIEQDKQNKTQQSEIQALKEKISQLEKEQ